VSLSGFVEALALAAIVVLVLAPEALLHPSFQTSFCGDAWPGGVQIAMPRLFATPENSAAAKVALWAGRELVTLTLASLVAGLATTPYAAFHFHRIMPYGVQANLAAMPVVSAVARDAFLVKEGLAADAYIWPRRGGCVVRRWRVLRWGRVRGADG
jgi:predicted membrane metal-binding protein